jgi:hypothetical protein
MPAPPAALRAGLDRRPALTTAALAGLLVLGFVLLRLAFATSLGGFVVASDEFVDPSRTPDRLEVVTGTRGYDGQFVYRLAVDPWTAEPTEHGIRLDNPAYRQQRIATPVFAWTVAMLPGVSTALALVLVNAAALLVAAWYASRLATEAGRHPLCGLVLAFPACMPISLARDLTEPVAWAAVLAGLYCGRRGRWAAAGVALTVAVLARETSIVVVVGLALGAVIEASRSRSAVARSAVARSARSRSAVARSGVARAGGRVGPTVEPDLGFSGPSGTSSPSGASGRGGVAGSAGWLLLPVLVAVAWQAALWQIWGTLPLRSGGAGNLGGLPLLGVLGSLVADLPDFTSPAIANPLVGALVFGERIAVLALFCYAGVAIVSRHARLRVGESIAWALAVTMALSLRGWSTDVQFLRAANEAVGLSLLVAVGDDRPAGRAARSLGAALAAGVALMYAVRQ